MRYLALALVGLAMLVASASARIVIVAPDGPGDLPTIQTAINATTDGDIIELKQGIFTGDGNRDLDFSGKAIKLRSQDGVPDMCIIDCGGTATEAHRGMHFHSGEGTDTVIEAMTITGGYTTLSGDGASGGAILCDTASPTITNCTFYGNSATEGGSVALRQGSTAWLEDCILALGTMGEAIWCSDDSDAVLACSDIFGNAGGDWLGCVAGQLGTNGNISADPLFCDAENGDFTIAGQSPCAPVGAPECGLIGAWPVGCEVTPVRPWHWGQIKALFRR